MLHIYVEETEGEQAQLRRTEELRAWTELRRTQSVSPRLEAAQPRTPLGPAVEALLDPQTRSSPNYGKPLGRGRSHSLPHSLEDADSARPDEELDVRFSCGNPIVEAINGVARLYRENWCGDQLEALQEGVFGDEMSLPARRSSRLCMIGVPNFVSGSELCKFLEPFEASLKELRIVRGQSSSWYMVLITCVSQEAAEEFYLAVNGRPFNLVEPEVTKLVGDSLPSAVPPPAGTVELPACPVCLERLDSSSSGILTILCNHSFHTRCLAGWKDSSCPVCRYLQQPAPKPQACSVCGISNSLWMCLICGFVGCGRYAEKHAEKHFLETQHTFSLELDTQRVWDYVGDGYVHRLVQEKKGGVVQIEEKGAAKAYESASCEKIEEAVLAEYNYLLTSQLEAQRLYFEEKLARGDEKAGDLLKELEASKALLVKTKEQHKRRVKELEREKRDLRTRCEKKKESIEFLQQLNETLVANQKEYAAKLEECRKEHDKKLRETNEEIAELKEEVRDLMQHFDAQGIVAQREELQDGSVELRGDTSRLQGDDGEQGTPPQRRQRTHRKRK